MRIIDYMNAELIELWKKNYCSRIDWSSWKSILSKDMLIIDNAAPSLFRFDINTDTITYNENEYINLYRDNKGEVYSWAFGIVHELGHYMDRRRFRRKPNDIARDFMSNQSLKAIKHTIENLHYLEQASKDIPVSDMKCNLDSIISLFTKDNQDLVMQHGNILTNDLNMLIAEFVADMFCYFCMNYRTGYRNCDVVMEELNSKTSILMYISLDKLE